MPIVRIELDMTDDEAAAAVRLLGKASGHEGWHQLGFRSDQVVKAEIVTGEVTVIRHWQPPGTNPHADDAAMLHGYIADAMPDLLADVTLREHRPFKYKNYLMNVNQWCCEQHQREAAPPKPEGTGDDIKLHGLCNTWHSPGTICPPLEEWK